MPMLFARSLHAVLLPLIIAGLCVCGVGCRSTKPEAKLPDPLALNSTHYFLNTATPYDRLVVEIDAVAGTEPALEELNELEAFLKQYCDKPGGIVIKVDSVIPREIARRRSPTSLALEYLNGPGDDRAAFLYVLFYEGKLQKGNGRKRNPEYLYFPYPGAILVNRSYHIAGDFYHAQWAKTLLLHEAGHALGLALNEEHGNAGHCINRNCRMKAAIRYNLNRFLTFRNPWVNTGLCEDCRRDLEAGKTAIAPANQRFRGKYFMRAEAGYQVLGLPGFVYVHFGQEAEISDEHLEEKRREALASFKPDGWLEARSNAIQPGDHLAALAQLSKERNDDLRNLARDIFSKVLANGENLSQTDTAEARKLITSELVAAAQGFPGLRAKLEALRRKVNEPGSVKPPSNSP